MIRDFHERFDRVSVPFRLLVTLALCVIMTTAASPPWKGFPIAASLALLFPVVLFAVTRAWYLCAPTKKNGSGT